MWSHAVICDSYLGGRSLIKAVREVYKYIRFGPQMVALYIWPSICPLMV